MTKLLNFQIMEEDEEIRNVKCIEELTKTVKELKVPLEKRFVNSIQDEYFSKTDAVSRFQKYFQIIYKYAGNEIKAMMEHFVNTAGYAHIIGQQKDMCENKLTWNQNIDLFLERGAYKKKRQVFENE